MHLNLSVRRGRPRLTIAAAALLLGLAAPEAVFGHQLSAVFQSRLPLAVYLAGAAAAVGLSFAFVLLRDVRAAAPADDGRRLSLPPFICTALRAIGVGGWAWIAAQAIVGGETDAEVARLFTWVYGWVGIALLSALVGPIWHRLDPFSGLFDLLGWIGGRLGLAGLEPAGYPARLGRWPATIGLAAVVWLELVASGGGSRTLGFLVIGYTAYTLAMMAQFGRDAWRANGEIFSVWFGLLGRLAPITVADDGRLRWRGFARGLLDGGWATSDLVLIGLGVGSILFDGLSQTAVWVDAFGLPAVGPETLLLAGFLGLIIGAALLVSGLVGLAATGAGLLPIAVGYLLAHYLTFLLIEGERIVVALSDPLQRGWDLFGFASFEPSAAWLPPAPIWTIQLAAVVGGHMLGAWGGHVVAARDGAGDPARLRLRQVPLALVMVGLTTLTLWSLGQALFIPVPA